MPNQVTCQPQLHMYQPNHNVIVNVRALEEFKLVHAMLTTNVLVNPSVKLDNNLNKMDKIA